MSTAWSSSGPIPQRDEEQRLRELGYQPVLARRMGGFGNFAISFSVISILSGCMTLYGFGLDTGGPAVMMWGWAGVGLFVLCVGLSLAEVTSAYPTSGALYYMADRLGGRTWGWYTGWLNLLGLLGAIAGIDYGAALFTGALFNLQWGFDPTPESTMVIFVCILLVHAALNLFGVRLVSVLNSVSVWWHLAGVAIIVGALAIVPSHHQSPEFVFTEFVNDTGWSNPLYVTAIGLLLAQYTFSGYDASAHLSEETSNASVYAARGIVRAIWVSWVAGFVLLAGLTFAIQDYAGTQKSATGVPPAQILIDALGTGGATAMLLIVIVAQLFCGNAEVAAASRMVFAFSRDGALPGSRLWQRVSSRTQTPVLAVWLSVAVAGLLALPSLYSETAYGAVTAINVIGITPAYAIPVFLRLRAGDRFQPGPWNLGRWSKPVGWTAVVWVALVTVLFCLPQSSPVTADSMNYASIALAVVLLLATIWWFVARRSYNTPSAYGTAREQAEIAEGIV
ncbi:MULTISPECIES: amino acid permease [Streptomyces]|uniref:Amino acid permease n=2 Tax=Streptomyces malaysiensis TaxID=92644 RepID=A0ABX6WG21_STRMQ|nr:MULTISPECIES: amino acid permease [Streptomyces]MYU16496.1 amino acid permease [Streptomyces sp. SID8361]ATL87597.1 amino acid/metabolite permease [Streptomyces malaysiensis]AUA09205.1 Putrescine importer PuuP [Streptomyces sp. M56]MCC4319091.1 amino acid permease [Streptomyces malaysiensis]MCD9590120.1 amino acid permease [Streptomyces sp. 8ZJF_21]